MMLYEDRYTIVDDKKGREYLDLCREKTIPAVRAAGGQVLCLATGLVGDPGSAFLQMTAFASPDTWQAAQEVYTSGREELVESEQVRLLRQVAYLPDGVPAPEDRRACYSYRRFFIRRANLERFVETSEKGVWPLYHAADCRVLGLWTTLAAADPMEVLLMAGYHGPGHWEETRFVHGKPEGIDEEVWKKGREMGAERNQLRVGRTWVRLFRAHDFY